MKVQWTELKDKVKASVNLKELVEEYTVLTPAGNNVWSGHCPHPDHNDRTPSFRVYKNSNGTWSFRCFGCQDIYEKKGQNGNYGSDCFAFLQWMSDYKGSPKVLTFMDSLKTLAEREGITWTYDNKQAESAFKTNEQFCSLAEKNLLSNVKAYLLKRGLNEEDIRMWRIGAWPYKEGGKTVLRITFPLFNRMGKIAGFSSRLLKEEGEFSKYKNSSNSSVFQKGKYLYGQHLVDISLPDIRITEGQFDVILATKYGLKNVVATLGTSFTQDHALWIKQHTLIPTFIFDNDKAGIAAIDRAANVCNSIGLSSKVCILPQNCDLAEFASDKKGTLSTWIEHHTVPTWYYKLSDIAVTYESALQELRRSILPDIRNVMPVNQEDKILMQTFVKERFGIVL